MAKVRTKRGLDPTASDVLAANSESTARILDLVSKINSDTTLSVLNKAAGLSTIDKDFDTQALSALSDAADSLTRNQKNGSKGQQSSKSKPRPDDDDDDDTASSDSNYEDAEEEGQFKSNGPENTSSATPSGKREGGKKCITLTVQQKKEVLDLIDLNTSYREISKMYNISAGAITGIKHDREMIYSYISKKGNNPSMKRIKLRLSNESSRLDEIIYAWYCEAKRRSEAISGPIMKEKAMLVAHRLGMSDFKASNGWINSFQKRHQISFRDTNERYNKSYRKRPRLSHSGILDNSNSMLMDSDSEVEDDDAENEDAGKDGEVNISTISATSNSTKNKPRFLDLDLGDWEEKILDPSLYEAFFASKRDQDESFGYDDVDVSNADQSGSPLPINKIKKRPRVSTNLTGDDLTAFEDAHDSLINLVKYFEDRPHMADVLQATGVKAVLLNSLQKSFREFASSLQLNANGKTDANTNSSSTAANADAAVAVTNSPSSSSGEANNDQQEAMDVVTETITQPTRGRKGGADNKKKSNETPSAAAANSAQSTSNNSAEEQASSSGNTNPPATVDIPARSKLVTSHQRHRNAKEKI